MVLLQIKLYFSKDPEGVQHFPGGGVGGQMLISIEIHITCDFPGGGGGLDPIPPSGSAHVKLSVYKCTNSVRSAIKLKAVLHMIVNIKIKV